MESRTRALEAFQNDARIHAEVRAAAAAALRYARSPRGPLDYSDLIVAFAELFVSAEQQRGDSLITLASEVQRLRRLLTEPTVIGGTPVLDDVHA